MCLIQESTRGRGEFNGEIFPTDSPQDILPPLTGLDLQGTLVEVSAIFKQFCGWR